MTKITRKGTKNKKTNSKESNDTLKDGAVRQDTPKRKSLGGTSKLRSSPRVPKGDKTDKIASKEDEKTVEPDSLDKKRNESTEVDQNKMDSEVDYEDLPQKTDECVDSKDTTRSESKSEQSSEDELASPKQKRQKFVNTRFDEASRMNETVTTPENMSGVKRIKEADRSRASGKPSSKKRLIYSDSSSVDSDETSSSSEEMESRSRSKHRRSKTKRRKRRHCSSRSRSSRSRSISRTPRSRRKKHKKAKKERSRHDPYLIELNKLKHELEELKEGKKGEMDRKSESEGRTNEIKSPSDTAVYVSRFGFNRLLYLFYRVMISRENSSWADSSSFIYDRNTYQQNANK